MPVLMVSFVDRCWASVLSARESTSVEFFELDVM